MRQTDGYEDRSGGLPLIYMALAVSFFVLMILLLVLFMNRDQSKPAYIAEGAGGGTEQVASGQGGAYLSQGSDLTVGGDAYAPEDSTADSAGSGGMVAGDLDFWDMYPMGGEGLEEESGEERDEDSKEQENVLPDPSADGNHVEIVYADGTSEWVPINPYWKKNTYDFTNLVSKNKLLEYYSDGKQVSFLGVDLSRYQKDVDFRALKRERFRQMNTSINIWPEPKRPVWISVFIFILRPLRKRKPLKKLPWYCRRMPDSL